MKLASSSYTGGPAPCDAYPPGTFGALAERLRSLVSQAAGLRSDSVRVRDAILGSVPEGNGKSALKSASNGHIETLDSLMSELSDEFGLMNNALHDLANKI